MFRLVCITKLKLLALYLRSLCKQYTAIAIRVGSKIATCKNTQYFFFSFVVVIIRFDGNILHEVYIPIPDFVYLVSFISVLMWSVFIIERKRTVNRFYK